MMAGRLKLGDFIIYEKVKRLTRPGPRAHGIRPAVRGDDYAYHASKYWLVVAAGADGNLVARTRRGKEHPLSGNDPAVRKATWWERRVYRKRFPKSS